MKENHMDNVAVVDVGDSEANIIVDGRFCVLVERARVADIVWIMLKARENPVEQPRWLS